MRDVCGLVAGLAAGMVAMQGASAQPYLGVGVASLSSWRLRVQAMRHRFSARDAYGEGPFGTRSNELSASAMYVFR